MKEALLYEKQAGKIVRCFLCAHRCLIREGGVGFCGVRQNQGGVLYSLVYGKIIAQQVDPIEKKPLYHFLPGSNSYSIATVGCNFRCDFCQNWEISQKTATDGLVPGEDVEPAQIVQAAKAYGCASIAYTYTEPTISLEFARDVAYRAHAHGLANVFVTNGYMTEECARLISPYLDAANVDLKFFNEASYRRICKASLAPVCDSIRRLKELGIWVEVTTLVIPGENDSENELRGIAEFLAGIDRHIPWHISRFHPDYKFDTYPVTPRAALARAESCARQAGLIYVYTGNVQEQTQTACYHCGKVLIKREIFTVLENTLLHGACPACGTKMPGVFEN
ncbi:MAG TPA: AmmeMemoRadiSam system radical SAM enzyme [Candidatus Omnitrophota bacterium]|nr:AmmeMemoRadiSam system radical SAM enzyme [Candidatus Omnitrophota bacterium]